MKRQHPVCWQRARPVSPGCPCVPGNCCCRAAPAPGTARGCCPRCSGSRCHEQVTMPSVRWVVWGSSLVLDGIWGSWRAQPRIFPLLCSPNLAGGAGGAVTFPHPAVIGVCPRRSEPSLPGTAGPPATISRLLIPRDKSGSLMSPEEEKRRALGREQQTRRWIRCSLPDWVSHEFPCVTRGGTGGAGGNRGGNGGELVVQGLGSPWCFHPPPPTCPCPAALPGMARL